ncbi:hypothetical protein EV13_0756 [Prochlorococcus sp. MIT 0702]|nr:hypothetical protein EV12_0286 [Prochlorococcus sp. MIT 0701]KGG29952.1 hypothetical protein EV13_0756 [Prochlorococcus sp. MIT 0702]
MGWDELLRGHRYRDHGIQSFPNATLSRFLPVESASVARLASWLWWPRLSTSNSP